MDPQDKYIIEELKSTDDIMEIVNGLMREFSLTREQGESKYAKFISNYTSLNGEIIENTGFPFQIHLDKTTNIVYFVTFKMLLENFLNKNPIG